MSSMLRRAKTLEEAQFAKLLSYIDQHSATPERDRLMLLLSFKAGLRAGEIAQIDMSALTDAEGAIAKKIVVSRKIAKKGREREIPMNPDIRKALAAFRKKYPNATYIAVSPHDDNPHMTPNTVAQYLRRVFHRAGFEGCSSHSGRRTFGTTLARRANNFGNSLRDVQKLMGHARLDTTERYIDAAHNTFSLVASL